MFTIIGLSIKNESYQNNCDPCCIITTLAIPTTMFRGNWFVENESYQNTCGPCCKIITHTIPTNIFRRNWFVYYYRSVDQILILSKHLHLDFPLVWLHTEDYLPILKACNVCENVWDQPAEHQGMIKNSDDITVTQTNDGSCLDSWTCPGQLAINLNPSNAEATFVQSTRTQISLKDIWTLSCWYSSNSSRWVLSDEYPFARVSIIISFFTPFCIGQISHHQRKG